MGSMPNQHALYNALTRLLNNERATIPLNLISSTFRLSSAPFQSTPLMAEMIMQHLDCNPLRRMTTVKTWCADPNAPLKPGITDHHPWMPFGMLKKCPPLVTGLTHKTLGGDDAFALLIRPRTLDDRRTHILFGIRGVINRQGGYEVHRLFLPVFDKYRRQTGVFSPAVTENNIHRALYYARLCADQLFNEAPITAYANYSDATELDTASILQTA